MIIDSHGHYTTLPPAVDAWRSRQIAELASPAKGSIRVSDDEIRESLENGQIKRLRERGTDKMFFSPRASSMGHHFGGERISLYWTQHCNDLIARVVSLYPDDFIPVCQLPQSPGVPPKASIEELERCVNMGFVGCVMNPDPSGGYWTDPPLNDKDWWYPFYEKLVELDTPAMVHVSATCNPNFHSTASHYMNADTTAIVQLHQSTVFQDFPGLRIIVPHGGGAIPYQFGRFRGIALRDGFQPFDEFIKNIYFDTAIYDRNGLELLLKVAGIDNVLFASEMIGAVNAIDPQTGRYFDDLKPTIDEIDWLTDEDRTKLFEGNVKHVYPRLKQHLRD